MGELEHTEFRDWLRSVPRAWSPEEIPAIALEPVEVEVVGDLLHGSGYIVVRGASAEARERIERGRLLGVEVRYED